MYVFSRGERSGEVNIGKTISIRYWILVNSSKARFIQIEGKAKPKLIAGLGQKIAGVFRIKSTLQPRLDIYLSPKLWEKVKDAPTREQLRLLEKTMAREANMSVLVEGRKNQYRILSIRID